MRLRCQPQNDIRIALAGAAQIAQAIDNVRGKPDFPLAIGVSLLLVGDRPERQGQGNGVKGGLSYSDVDHGRLSRG